MLLLHRSAVFAVVILCCSLVQAFPPYYWKDGFARDKESVFGDATVHIEQQTGIKFIMLRQVAYTINCIFIYIKKLVRVVSHRN